MPSPTLTTLFDFYSTGSAVPYGAAPAGGVTIDAQGNLYGTAEYGGANGDGVLFKYSTATGTMTKLVDFSQAYGLFPTAAPVLDASGKLIGDTTRGGAMDGLEGYGYGALYQYSLSAGYITTGANLNGAAGTPDYPTTRFVKDSFGRYDLVSPSNNLILSYSPAGYYFQFAVPVSYGPLQGNLYASAGGLIYGETGGSPSHPDGTIYALNLNNYTTHIIGDLSAATGIDPVGGLVADAAGNLYGTTDEGGANGVGTVFKVNPTTGTITKLADFNAATNGDSPTGSLLIDANGNLFGENAAGGSGGKGTIFEVNTTTDSITTVLSFPANGAGGAAPSGGLTVDAQGDLFGTTVSGGNVGQIYGTPGGAVTGGLGTLFEVTNSGFAVADPGPTTHNATMRVGVGGDYDISAYLLSLVQPGLTGDTETITATTGNAHTSGSVTYYWAPASAGVDSFTYTVTDQHGNVSTATIAVTVSVASATTVHLNGYNDQVIGSIEWPEVSSGLAGATINGPASGGAHIVGTHDDITINAFGYGNTIDAGGGADTINTGSGGDSVTVSDDNAANIVTGGAGNETVVLPGAGNNTIALGGYNNRIVVGSGHNTINAGLGNANVTMGDGADVVTAAGYYNSFTLDRGTYTLSGMAGYSTINIGMFFDASSSIDLTGFTGSMVAAGGVWELLKSDGELFATLSLASGIGVHLIGDGHGGEELVYGAPTPPSPPTHLIETMGGLNIALTAPTTWLTTYGYNNTVTGGDTNYLIDGDLGGSHFTLGNGLNSLLLGGYGDTVTVGNGMDTIAGTTGGSTFNLGTGAYTITGSGYYDVLNINGGNVVVNGLSGLETFNVGSGFTGGALVELSHLQVSLVQVGGVWELLKADGELYATLHLAAGVTLHTASDGGDGTVLRPGAPTPPAQPVNVVETSGGQHVTVDTSTQSVTLFGYGNTVTGAGGTLSISGDAGGSTFNLTSGNNTLLLGGYGDNISLDVGGSGNNSVSGTLGNTTIHTGDGNQTIVAHGYYNTIVLGNGNSNVSGIDGNSTVTVGSASGTGSIAMAGNGNTVNLGGSYWNVTAGSGGDTVNCGTASTNIVLAGWNNVVTSTLGNVTVNGAWGTDFKVNGDGMFNITNFSATNGDVLDLSGLTSTLAPGWSVSGVADSFDASAVDVVVTSLGVGHLAAILHGANASVASLVASHNIIP